MILKIKKCKEQKECFYNFKDCDNFATLNVLLLLNGIEFWYALCDACFNDLKKTFDIIIKNNSEKINNRNEKCINQKCNNQVNYAYQENNYFWYFCEQHFNGLGVK